MSLLDQLLAAADKPSAFVGTPTSNPNYNNPKPTYKPKKPTVPAKEKNEDWFVQGKIPGSWLGKAAHLPGGHTFHVAVAIWYVKGLGKGNIVLDKFIFDRFGVTRNSACRALERLRESGLIEYVKDGHKHSVTILSVESETVPDDSTENNQNDP